MLIVIAFVYFSKQDEFKKDNPAIAANISKDIYPYVARAYNPEKFREEFGRICASINSFDQEKKIEFFMTTLLYNIFDGDTWWYFCDGIRKSQNEFFWDWLRKFQDTEKYKNIPEWQKQRITSFLSAHDDDFLYSISPKTK